MKIIKQLFGRLFSDVSQVPEVLKVSYFPSLDGFRALSVIIVVTWHFYFTVSSTFYYDVINGPMGVDIFFVISGFLITTLLLKEKANTASISLKKFYTRRVLRIFPAAYTYLFTVLAISLFFGYYIDKVNIAACFLYLADFSQLGNAHSTWATGHFWSLAVEEQFYLIFPFILKTNFRVYISTLLFILVFLPLLFIIMDKFPLINIRPIYYVTHFLIKLQGIAVGSLTAILLFKKVIDIENLKVSGILANFINLFLLLSIFLIHYDPNFSINSVLKNGLISILIAMLLIFNIFKPRQNLFYKFLNTRIMKYIGVLSYSIYIWHILITDSYYKPLPAIFYKMPYSYVGIFILAFLSYNFVEKPFLRLKKKFSTAPVPKRQAVEN